MQNDWLLVIAENEEVEAEDTALLVRAGFPEKGIRTAKGDDALGFINSRLMAEKLRERPGLLIFDLDHASGEGRARLKKLMMALKGTPEYKSLPLLMLVRPDYHPDDVVQWYKEGINAVALRPNKSEEDALAFFKSLHAFWQGKVVLVDPSWGGPGVKSQS